MEKYHLVFIFTLVSFNITAQGIDILLEDSKLRMTFENKSVIQDFKCGYLFGFFGKDSIAISNETLLDGSTMYNPNIKKKKQYDILDSSKKEGATDKEEKYILQNQKNNMEDNNSFKDNRDGRIYKIVRIGDQVWMAENLNYDALNGTLNLNSLQKWMAKKLNYDVGIGCWCYDNNPGNSETYGRLYDWETAKKSCPAGWHLPSDDEWKTLEIYLGMSKSDADISEAWRGAPVGNKLKSISIWNYEDNNNSSGFNALPGGFRFHDGGQSYYLGIWTKFWTSSLDRTNAGLAWIRELWCSSKVKRGSENILNGYSVRCIKD